MISQEGKIELPFKHIKYLDNSSILSSAIHRRGNTALGAKFVPDPGLALGDAVDVRFMQGIDFTAALWGLVQQTRDQDQGVEPSVQRADRFQTELSA